MLKKRNGLAVLFCVVLVTVAVVLAGCAVGEAGKAKIPSSNDAGKKIAEKTDTICQDSDGENIFKKGEVTFKGKVAVDGCLVKMNNVLNEALCVNNQYHTKVIDCPFGSTCKDGACVVEVDMDKENKPPVLEISPYLNEVALGQVFELYVAAGDPDDDGINSMDVTYAPEPIAKEKAVFGDVSSALVVTKILSDVITLTWTPNDISQIGKHTFIFSATDAKGGKSEKQVTIEVTSGVKKVAIPKPNNPPVLAPIGNKSVVIGETLAFNIAATDKDGDKLTYSFIPNGFPAGATLTNNNDGTATFNYTAPMKEVGGTLLPAGIKVSDAKGGEDVEIIYITLTEATG